VNSTGTRVDDLCRALNHIIGWLTVIAVGAWMADESTFGLWVLAVALMIVVVRVALPLLVPLFQEVRAACAATGAPLRVLGSVGLVVLDFALLASRQDVLLLVRHRPPPFGPLDLGLGSVALGVIGAGLTYRQIRDVARRARGAVRDARKQKQPSQPPSGLWDGDRKLDGTRIEFWLVMVVASALGVFLGADRLDLHSSDVEFSQWVSQSGPLIWGLGALLVLSLAAVTRMVVRRFNAEGRRQAEWHRWLVFAGPSVAGIAKQWRQTGEPSGSAASKALGQGAPIGQMPIERPEAFGSTSTAMDGLNFRPPSTMAINGLMGGHPIGVALWASLTVGKLAFAGAKDAIALQTESKEVKAERKRNEGAAARLEEKAARERLWHENQRLLREAARQKRLLGAKSRMVEMVAEYDGAPRRLFLRFTPRGCAWPRDEALTRKLLAAVEESLVPNGRTS
jgi:hypothetical protein